jgi:2-keto-4-pentenoate hydratase
MPDSLSSDAISTAAATLWDHWMQSRRLEALPAACRPADRAGGYAVQAGVCRLSGQRVVGWKIAATSQAGQRHIAVDGPLAGPLLAGRALAPDAAAPLAGNHMRVAEAEFAFRIGRPLPRRETPYSVGEVLDAVDALHPAIEVPDSRYTDFTRVGAPQLIADCACACWYRIGPEVRADWRARDLVAHAVTAYRNGDVAGQGTGANVLGDPRVALAWLANEVRVHGPGLASGDVVITGTCIVPVAVAPGDRVRMDFGEFGDAEMAFE